MDLYDDASFTWYTEDDYETIHSATRKREIEIYLLEGVSINKRDKYGNTALHLTKSEECARTLLQNGAEVNPNNWKGETPLHYAIRKHSNAITADNNWIPTLIEYGADVQAKDSQGRTPLHYARSKEMIELLLKHGASIHEVDSLDCTALHLSKSEECTRTLLENGAEVNSRCYRDETPLHHAVTINSHVITAENNWIPILFEYGADVNARDSDGRTPLHHARSKEIIELLLKHGALINGGDNEGNAALHLSNSAEVAGALLVNGAEVDFRNNRGDTALHCATQGDSSKFSFDRILKEVRIQTGSDTSIINCPWTMPLYYAHPIEMIRLLLRGEAIFEERDSDSDVIRYSSNSEVTCRHCDSRIRFSSLNIYSQLSDATCEHWVPVRIIHSLDVNNKVSDNTTPLHRINTREMIEMLVKNKIFIRRKFKGTIVFELYESIMKMRALPKNCIDVEQGLAPKSIASYDYLHVYPDRFRGVSWVLTLIEFEADVNAKSSDGATPLHRADSREMIELLLNYGARINERDSRGNTALHLSNSEEKTRTLLENGADVDARNSDGDAPLHFARSREIIELLLKYGARINERNDYGDTALHLSHSEEKTRTLIENGAGVNSRNNRGETALHLAASKPITAENNWIPILVRYGAEVDALSEDGKTPLEYAIDGRRNLITVTSLIENGANFRRRFKRGANLLHLAAVRSHDDQRIFEILVEQGVDINATNDRGLTPLHYSSLSMGRHFVPPESNIDHIKSLVANQISLLQLGADVNVATREGFTAFKIEAVQRGSFDERTTFTSITLHMFRLQAAGLYISDINRRLLYRIEEWIDDTKKAYNSVPSWKLQLIYDLQDVIMKRLYDEVTKLRSCELNFYGWSLLDLLKTDDHQYITSEPVLDFNIDLSNYPLYGGLIKSKLIRDVKKAGLFEICREYFSMLMRASKHLGGKPLPSLPHELEVKILSLLGFTSHINLILCGRKVASELARLGIESKATAVQLPDVVDRPEVAYLLPILKLILKGPSPVLPDKTVMDFFSRAKNPYW